MELSLRWAERCKQAFGEQAGKAMFGKTTSDGYSAYIAIPGVIQFGAGLGTDSAPIGGAWTGVI